MSSSMTDLIVIEKVSFSARFYLKYIKKYLVTQKQNASLDRNS